MWMVLYSLHQETYSMFHKANSHQPECFPETRQSNSYIHSYVPFQWYNTRLNPEQLGTHELVAL